MSRTSGPTPLRAGAAAARRRLWTGALLLPLVGGGFALQSWAASDSARVFHEVLAHVAERGVDSIGADRLYERAARGLLGEIGDPYAELFSPEQLAEFSRQTLRNSYAGVGMQITLVRDTATVMRVFAGSAAEGGGVRPGDRIVHVGGEGVTGIPLDRVTARLLGPPGTTVAVTFRRGDASVARVFTRTRVRYPSVRFSMMVEPAVGYLTLEGFNDTSAEEVAAAIRALRDQGATSYIVDLRGNTGGSVDQALRIAGLFLPRGTPLLRAAFRNGPSESHVADRDPLLPVAPVVLLTDGASASASEIVAGALQDHDRAAVVGAATFGKGVVQDIFTLDGGWALKLTTGRWYTPSGRTIQRTSATGAAAEPVERPVFRSAAGRPVYGGGGIAPDVPVAPDTLEGADRELMRALATRGGTVNQVVQELAVDLFGTVEPSFRSGPAWRGELRSRLERRGVTVADDRWAAGSGVVDRLIETRVAELAHGDSAAFRRTVHRDAQLQAGIGLLRGSGSQAETLRRAARAADRS
jgi:carboxyl-terminal processing protease